jgi:hypothetical protein
MMPALDLTFAVLASYERVHRLEPVKPLNTGLAGCRIVPRDFTAAATGRHWKRYDLGIIRRTGLDVQTDFPALTL